MVDPNNLLRWLYCHARFRNFLLNCTGKRRASQIFEESELGCGQPQKACASLGYMGHLAKFGSSASNHVRVMNKRDIRLNAGALCDPTPLV